MLRHGIQKFALTAVMAMIALTSQASAFVLPAHRQVLLYMDANEPAVVQTAVSLLQSDLQRVLNAPLQYTDSTPQILVGTWTGPSRELLAATGIDFSWLDEYSQAFMLSVTADGRLVIAGSDACGTAYGVIEMTRLLGVSAWEWWADVDVERLLELRLPDGFSSLQAPNVAFRGICIGDEDWGFLPWTTTNFEPNEDSAIGEKTTERVFELMLRLRANLYWPPSRPCTRPFEWTAECREMAERYGITLGKDVHEPLSIPDTPAPLMCVDDGFGYLLHFPTSEESELPQGCGVYYHVSYQGVPHDYLWLGTASPFLMFQQLSEACYHGAYYLWMLNVGDIKPHEYQISLFMDMAWNLEGVRQLTVATHLEEFFAQTIGRDVARLTSIYMKEFYHLAFQRKPEHMAGTRVDEPADGLSNWDEVHDLPWSEKKIRHRLSRYDQMQRNVRWVGDSVRKMHPHRTDAYFELVEYPVLATVAQNEKYLCAQLARHGLSYLQRDNVESTWKRSNQAHQQILDLTNRYNSLRDGKWRGVMNASPRNLSVFKPMTRSKAFLPIPAEMPTITTFGGASYDASSFAGEDVLAPVLGLGASIRAMPVPKACSVTYKYKYNYGQTQYADVEIHMLPTHPIEAQQRFSLSFDGSEPQVFTYDAEERSEQWKQNVLRNYTVVTARLPITRLAGEHSLTLTALDDGVVVDEIFIRK